MHMIKDIRETNLQLEVGNAYLLGILKERRHGGYMILKLENILHLVM